MCSESAIHFQRFHVKLILTFSTSFFSTFTVWNRLKICYTKFQLFSGLGCSKFCAQLVRSWMQQNFSIEIHLSRVFTKTLYFLGFYTLNEIKCLSRRTAHKWPGESENWGYNSNMALCLWLIRILCIRKALGVNLSIAHFQLLFLTLPSAVDVVREQN